MSRDDRTPVFPTAPAASEGLSLPAPTALLPSREHDTFLPPQHPHSADFNPRFLPSSTAPYTSLPNLPRDLPHPPLPTPHMLPPPLEVIHTPHHINGNSFPELTTLITTHPLLSVIFKKVFEICGAAAPFDNPYMSPYLEKGEQNAKELADVANRQGLDRACSKYTPTDVYMVALLRALDSLQTTLQSGCSLQNHALENTVLFAGKTISGPFWNASARTPPVSQNTARPSFWQVDAAMQQVPPHMGSSRTPLTEKAKSCLDKWFSDNITNPFPSIQEKLELSKECGMSLCSVNNWFGNKRMRIKRKMSLLPAPGDQLSGDAANLSDKVLAPQSKWQAIVISRMNTPAGREIIENATGRANRYSGDIPSSAGRVCDDDPDIHSAVRSGEQTSTAALGLHDQRVHHHHSSGGRGLDSFH